MSKKQETPCPSFTIHAWDSRAFHVIDMAIADLGRLIIKGLPAEEGVALMDHHQEVKARMRAWRDEHPDECRDPKAEDYHVKPYSKDQVKATAPDRRHG